MPSRERFPEKLFEKTYSTGQRTKDEGPTAREAPILVLGLSSLVYSPALFNQPLRYSSGDWYDGRI
jgi:hypothetical protein